MLGDMLAQSPSYFLALWLFVIVLSVFTSLMEIQIEGGNGWAGCLPSWRFAPSWMRALLNGKEITGYHVYFNMHTYLLFHMPLLFVGFSWMAELTILSLLFAYNLIEDALWFILNPHYGWQGLMKGNVMWYTKWWGPFPVEYYFSAGMSALCAFLRGYLDTSVGDPVFGSLPLPVQQLIGWIIGFLLSLCIMTLIALLVAKRNEEFRANDNGMDPGHPGVCRICTVQMAPAVVKTFVKKSSARSAAAIKPKKKRKK